MQVFSPNKFPNKVDKKKSGYSLVELVIIVGMISTLSGIVLPSFLGWVRAERVNAYTREIKEYFRTVRLEARRWGASCFVNVNSIDINSLPSNKDYFGFSVNCKYSNEPNSSLDSPSTIDRLIPAMNNSVFQVVNKNFQVTPNGRISSDESIVIIIGSRFQHDDSKMLNCLVIKSPTGHIIKGKYLPYYLKSDNMKVSQISEDNLLIPSNCISS